MLQIENLKVGYMTDCGSKVLKNITYSIPTLDIFIREAVQNSFDARDSKKPNVKIKINCGSFDREALSNEFESISNNLKNVNSSYSEYISFSDYNTTGLTGPSIIEEIPNNSQDWGKFLSLVRNVGRSYKEKDSGGSFGYGKTIYYRVGIGLVIFYSRFNDGGKYKERLMACLVEDEQLSTGVLKGIQKNNYSGIAWWGKKENDKLYPLTNSEEIEKILKCFKISPYKNDETGTAVIIPFVNSNILLDKTTDSIDENKVGWCRSLKDYLDISFQRWYPTRYDNKKLGSNYIELYINDEKKNSNEMYPLFKTIQALYNYGVNHNNKVDFNVEEIPVKINSILKNGPHVGTFYYCLLSEEDLKMVEPDLNKSPITCINNQLAVDGDEKVIISFCRKPGMILKYDYKDTWSNGIKTPDVDKYLIGLFLPNSDNKMETEARKITVEEYLRGCERAEHGSWEDFPEIVLKEGIRVDTSKLKIVDKIQKKIRNELQRLSSGQGEQTVSAVGSLLNKKLADLFLPKKGFGRNPSRRTSGGEGSGGGGHASKTNIKLLSLGVDEKSNLMKPFEINFAKNDKKAAFEFKISTENTDISATKWEEDAGPFVLKIVEIRINKIYFDKKEPQEVNISFTNNTVENNITFEKKLTENNSWYGFEFDVNNTKINKLEGSIHYIYLDKSITTNLVRMKVNK